VAVWVALMFVLFSSLLLGFCFENHF